MRIKIKIFGLKSVRNFVSEGVELGGRDGTLVVSSLTIITPLAEQYLSERGIRIVRPFWRPTIRLKRRFF